MSAVQKQESTGLKKTLELLAKTANEAAIGVLIPALDSTLPEIQIGALQAILDRRSPAGQREVLKRLHVESEVWRPIIDERRGRMAHALRDGVLGSDMQLCKNACQAILWFNEYDLAPVLITAIEDETHANADLAAETLLLLTDCMYEELASARPRGDRRDPQIIRRNFTACLEASVGRFAKHRRAEVVHAFLTLANRENSTLKQILLDPHHAAYLTVVDGLVHHTRPGVLRLLLSFLDDSHAPSSALTMLARRSDRKFLLHLLRKIGFEPSAVAALNLKKIESFPWLKQADALDSLELEDAAQHSLVQMLMACSAKRAEVYRTIEQLLRHGKPGGRRAAAAALARFNGAEANALALAALQDPDPEVQANVLGHLRSRGIPGALGLLVEMVDSPHEVVREAARCSLAEFDFERYLAAFDMLEDEVRKTTGVLVKKINPQAIGVLADELQSLSRNRRLKALAVASAMGAIPELEDSVIGLMSDEDHVLRADAARALGSCGSPPAIAALREALLDRSISVQEAAEQSLEKLSQASPARRVNRSEVRK